MHKNEEIKKVGKKAMAQVQQ